MTEQDFESYFQKFAIAFDADELDLLRPLFKFDHLYNNIVTNNAFYSLPFYSGELGRLNFNQLAVMFFVIKHTINETEKQNLQNAENELGYKLQPAEILPEYYFTLAGQVAPPPSFNDQVRAGQLLYKQVPDNTPAGFTCKYMTFNQVQAYAQNNKFALQDCPLPPDPAPYPTAYGGYNFYQYLQAMNANNIPLTWVKTTQNLLCSLMLLVYAPILDYFYPARLKPPKRGTYQPPAPRVYQTRIVDGVLEYVGSLPKMLFDAVRITTTKYPTYGEFQLASLQYMLANYNSIAKRLRAILNNGAMIVAEINKFKLESNQRLAQAELDSQSSIADAQRDAELLTREAELKAMDYARDSQFNFDVQMNQLTLLSIELDKVVRK